MTDEPIFIRYLIQQAHLHCDAEAITSSVAQTDQVSFDVRQLTDADVKKLLLFFKLPENTHPIDHRILVSDQYLVDVIFPPFKDYVRHLVKKKSAEQQSLDQVFSTNEESDDEDFVIIESSDKNEEKNYEAFPWQDPSHPLYFPPSQPNDPNALTRWDAMDKFSVENWYPHLKQHTFKSHFVRLNYDDIQYLIGNGSAEYNPTPLENSFDRILSTFKHQEAFMRLSTRSPKDSQFLFDEATTIMCNDFTYWNETNNKNQQLVSFVAAMTQAMKVASGKKIIETIIGSPRVYLDLLSLVSGSVPSQCTTNIVLREWYTIRPDHEFRVFVSRRCRTESMVTAISQYFHFLYFDKTPADCLNFLDEQSKEKLILKFQQYVLKTIDPAVAKFLNFSSEQDDDWSNQCIREYVVDLALIPINQYRSDASDENTIHIGGRSYVIVLIELNPFAPSATGALIFNWNTDLDRLWGMSPCQSPIFNYRTKPRDDFHSISLLPSNYEAVIQHAIAKRKIHSSPMTERSTSSSSVNLGNGFFAAAKSKNASCLEPVDGETKRSLKS